MLTLDNVLSNLLFDLEIRPCVPPDFHYSSAADPSGSDKIKKWKYGLHSC